MDDIILFVHTSRTLLGPVFSEKNTYQARAFFSSSLFVRSLDFFGHI